VNAVAYKGCRVEIAGFRSNTAPKLIDVADCFIDLGEIADKVRKDFAPKYEDREIHYSQQPPPPASFVQSPGIEPPCASVATDVFHPPIGSIIESNDGEAVDQFGSAADFVRVTDEQ
jgi:hypothetical protein